MRTLLYAGSAALLLGICLFVLACEPGAGGAAGGAAALELPGNPELEAQNAIKTGSLRFKGVVDENGAPVVPAVSSPLVQQLGYRMEYDLLPQRRNRKGDVEGQAELDALYHYAATYNGAIMGFMKGNPARK